MSGVEKNSIIAKLEQEEQAERARLAEQILAAEAILNPAVEDVFDAYLTALQAKRDKLAALKARLAGLPAERAALDAEEAQARADFHAAVENGEGLTTLTQDLLTINTKKQELEIMRDTLESGLIPAAEHNIRLAHAALEDVVRRHLGAILDTKLAEIMPRVQAINDEMRAWCYVRNDVLKTLGLTIYHHLPQLQGHFKKVYHS